MRISCIALSIISIHAPREGSDPDPPEKLCNLTISIHAPREGSDESIGETLGQLRISIHAPREGSDGCARCKVLERAGFQSTLPARGATR